MNKKISAETISAIKDGAVVELGANAEIKIIGKSVVLTIDGKNYDWDEDEVNWVDNCVKQINEVITHHNTNKFRDMKNLNNLMETINQFGSIDIVDEPNYLDAVCEYVMMNGVHSDWNAVNECMRCMVIGDGSINDIKGKALAHFLKDIYPIVSRLYFTWSYPLYTEDERYAKSKEDITTLLELVIDLRDFIKKTYQY